MMQPRLCALIAILSLAHAHNWLTRPMAYSTRTPTRDCKGSQCTNACQPIKLPKDMLNTVKRPAARWRRGQSVEVSWAKNNHHGGLFRISIVPVPSMNDRRVHKKLAILYGCFESGEYSCRKARHPCGTDKKGTAYRRRFTVPSTLIDGNYVLGYVWYGGLHFKKKRGQFPDFYSCSFIRIQGGKPVSGRHTAKWAAGVGKDIRNGQCHTATGSIGVCGNKGCGNRKSFWTRANEFKSGSPPSYSVDDVRKAFNVKHGANSLLSGFCKSNVCCAKSCGGCGGSNCSKKRGGARGCCIGTIKRSKKSCKKNPPPCVIDV